MDREYAREQELPATEVEILRSLTPKAKFFRARQLFDAGWTLQAIGNAFTPVASRSRVQYWVKQAESKYKTNNIVPSPWADGKPDTGYQRKTPISPGIPQETQERLRYLAPLARYYRSGMGSSTPSAMANEEMNEIVLDLYSNDVKITEIAKASGVTNRAIARRLGK
jgi:hypothetical protein